MMFEKQRIGLIRAHDGILMLQQLRFAAEITPRSEIKTPSLPKPTPVQVDLATQLMERYSAPFYIEDFRNEQIDHIDEVIERKAKGLAPRRQPRVAPHATSEEELMPTLTSLLRSQNLERLIS
jgi:DNA end-binding protein Ku